MDDEPFNPDYVEVDRVLDISESTDENGEVLWCSSVIFHGFESPPPFNRTHTLIKPPCCFCVQTVTLYLVKWCSLPYEDSTWELKADIDQSKIEEYERIVARTPSTKRVASIRLCLLMLLGCDLSPSLLQVGVFLCVLACCLLLLPSDLQLP